jgi:hypothetical protein
MIEIKIKRRKHRRILECKLAYPLWDFYRQYYEKQGCWLVTQRPELVGIFYKRYQMKLRVRK